MTTPLWPFALLFALLALVAFLRWRRWKRQAQQARRDLNIWKEALHAVAFEVANATNAVRANLLVIREGNPAVDLPEHLNQIATATDRIVTVLKVADDPAEWHRRKSAPQG